MRKQRIFESSSNCSAEQMYRCAMFRGGSAMSGPLQGGTGDFRRNLLSADRIKSTRSIRSMNVSKLALSSEGPGSRAGYGGSTTDG